MVWFWILNLYKMCAGKSRGLYFIAFAINKIYWEKLGKKKKKQTEEKWNFKRPSLILQTFDNMTLNSPLTEVRPDVLAAMWVRASLPVPGWKPNRQVQTLWPLWGNNLPSASQFGTEDSEAAKYVNCVNVSNVFN